MMAATPAKSETEKIIKSFAVMPGGTLAIESDRGSIKVETWDRQTVDVLVEKTDKNQKRLDGFKVDLGQTGNDIFVEGHGERNSKITAKGDINGGGDKMTLSTTNGDIHIKMLGE